MPTRTQNFAVFMVVGPVGAFLTATAFIAVIYLTLPPSDQSHGQGSFAALGDPFVLTIATSIVIVAGLLTSPIPLFFLRRRRLVVTLPILFTAVLTATAVTTPISQLLGVFSGFAALVISSIVSSRIRATSYGKSKDVV